MYAAPEALRHAWQLGQDSQLAQSPRQRLKLEEKARRQVQEGESSKALSPDERSQLELELLEQQQLQAKLEEQQLQNLSELELLEGKVARVHSLKHELVMKLREVRFAHQQLPAAAAAAAAPPPVLCPTLTAKQGLP